MLIHEILNKDIYIVPEEEPLSILNSKSIVYLAKNCSNTKYTGHIYGRLYGLINGKKCKKHNIDWWEGCLHLAYILTKNVGDNYLDTIMKYILVSLDN